MKSNNNVSPNQRLTKFRKRVQYGPIFVCSCCHQKFFSNQVEEFTEKLKEQIDTTNPKIREECIDEEILVDLGRDEKDVEIKCVYVRNLARYI